MKTVPKILLIIPPFATVDFPMIGPSIIAQSCNKSGLSTNILYSNLQLASKIGYSLYQRISISSFSIMAGDLLFRDYCFPTQFEKSEITFNNFFLTQSKIKVSSAQQLPITQDEINSCSKHIQPFLNDLHTQILDLDPEIIGISSVFQQNLPSIAIAKMIKATHPKKLVVMGGANASSPMGEALIEGIDLFDYIFSGEADFDFPSFAKDYLDSNILPSNKIIECVPVKNMDEIPYPDYHDYFTQLMILQKKGLLPNALPLKLPIETSRGCWWGAKQHCAFCGLNGKEISFRDKSGIRVLNEIEYLSSSYKVESFQATDNIMPLSFKRDVLPQLGQKQKRYNFFYEVKSNLKADELDQFCLAGVNVIQPGIESFSSNILELINKGVKGIQNLWLLRECLSRQIQVVWNILTDIPSDNIEDYDSMRLLIPKIAHFHPPQGVSSIIIDRYSPYHSFPERYKMKNVSPLSAYSLLYPKNFNLNNLAYHFTAEYETVFNNESFANRFRSVISKDWIQHWTTDKVPPKLYSISYDNNRLFIEDTRQCPLQQHTILNEECTSILKLLRTPQKNVINLNSPEFQYLTNMNFIINHEGYWMSIVVEPEIGFNFQKSKTQAIDHLAG